MRCTGLVHYKSYDREGTSLDHAEHPTFTVHTHFAQCARTLEDHLSNPNRNHLVQLEDGHVYEFRLTDADRRLFAHHSAKTTGE